MSESHPTPIQVPPVVPPPLPMPQVMLQPVFPVETAGYSLRLTYGIISIILGVVSLMFGVYFLWFARELWGASPPQTTVPSIPPPSCRTAAPVDGAIHRGGLTVDEERMFLDELVKAAHRLDRPDTIHYVRTIESLLSQGYRFHVARHPLTADRIVFTADPLTKLLTVNCDGYGRVQLDTLVKHARRDFVTPEGSTFTSWQLSPAGLNNLISAIGRRAERPLTPAQRGGIVMAFQDFWAERRSDNTLEAHQDAKSFAAMSILRSVAIRGTGTLEIIDEKDRKIWITPEGKLLENPPQELNPDTLQFPALPPRTEYPVSRSASAILLVEAWMSYPLAGILIAGGVMTVLHKVSGLRILRLWVWLKVPAVLLLLVGGAWAANTAQDKVMGNAGWMFDGEATRFPSMLLLAGLAAVWPVCVLLTLQKPAIREGIESLPDAK